MRATREREREREAIDLLRSAPFVSEKDVSTKSIEKYINKLSKEFGTKYAIFIFYNIEKIYENAISNGLYTGINPCHKIKNIKKITNHRGNTFLSIITWMLVIFASLSLATFAIAKFIIKEFGNVNIDQLLLHIRMAEGINIADTSMIKRALKYGSELFVAAILLITTTHMISHNINIKTRIRNTWNKIKNIIFYVKHSFFAKNTLYCLFLIGIISFSLLQTNKLLPFAQWATRKSSNWIEKNYYQLDTSRATFNKDQKRNLIMIILESIEYGFKDQNIYGENLIPELISLQSQGICFYGYKKTPGSSCTIDGLSAQTTGMPLANLGASWLWKTKYNNLLVNTSSIFNLLNNLGYKTAWFSGASGKFTAKHKFFHTHGMQECYDREHWENSGYPLNGKNIGISWLGYNDEFLFARLQEWLSSDNNTDTKFAILFETGDTHQPNGFASPIYYNFGDHRDSIRAASIMTSNFIKWAEQQPWYKNTTIIIVGDHPWMDAKNKFTQQHTSRSNNREIFNLILNSTIGTPGECFNIPDGFSAMDLAPTYLNAMGINFTSYNKKFEKLSNTRIGLGQSLFCDQPTLISKIGHERFIEKINRKSKFYRELF